MNSAGVGQQKKFITMNAFRIASRLAPRVMPKGGLGVQSSQKIVSSEFLLRLDFRVN